jgi:hypothetical protein
MTKYNSLLEGAKGILGDCIRILSDVDKQYVIVGGWSPVILNTCTTTIIFTDRRQL